MGALIPGSVLGGTYRVVGRIGVGGMGEVYEVAHARLAGRYAVKLLLRETAEHSQALERFRREAEITSALRHPNIVQIIDFNQTEDGAPYLVMEFLEGEDLSARLAREGATSIEFAISVVEQMASALSAAHKRGVVHRDLKPQNIFLVPVDGREHDNAKVLDFGISKVKSATKNLTLQDTVMGTPQYMAPEQAMGLTDEIDHRVDQFALAVIAYEMLAGRPPFEGENHHAVLYQVVHENPRPLHINGAPEIAASIEAVIRRALSKDRTARFASMTEFAKAFSMAARGTASFAVSTTAKVVSPTKVPKTERLPSDIRPQAAVTISGTGEMFPRRERDPRVAIVAGVVTAVGVVMAIFLGLRRPAPAVSARRAETSHPETTVPEIQKPSPSTKPVIDPFFTQPSTVQVEVEGAPTGVQVRVDGSVVGTLPVVLQRSAATHHLHFEAVGYEAQDVAVTADRDRIITLGMKRSRVRDSRSITTMPGAGSAALTRAAIPGVPRGQKPEQQKTWVDPFSDDSASTGKPKPTSAPKKKRGSLITDDL